MKKLLFIFTFLAGCVAGSYLWMFGMKEWVMHMTDNDFNQLYADLRMARRIRRGQTHQG